jgi:outer membrane lipoprotein-sorting protein
MPAKANIPATKQAIGGATRAALLAVAAVFFFAAASSAKVRDPVPLPKPRPAGAPAATADASPSPKKGVAGAIKAPISANSRFTPSQQEALFHINNYFNSFRTMQGDFIQFGPHGEQSEGVFYISRPGKIRFHYKPPVKLDVIADGRNVAVRDNRTMTQDYYPLGKTPLRYLLATSTNLTSDKLISEVRQEPDLIALVIVENSTFVKGKLTLIFDRESYALKQWIVTDAQGLNTSVAIYNVAVGKATDPKLFKINYQNLNPQ